MEENKNILTTFQDMDSDEEIVLSSHALAALQQFKAEEDARIKHFEELKTKSQEQFDKRQVTIDAFQEDWQLSQFWYADETAAILGRALLEGADDETVIVIASAPSVYAAIKNFHPEEIPTEHIYLLEYDTRFEILAGASHFSFYDYNTPEKIPEKLRHKCHRLLIDPPFLEEECQTKSAMAASNLLVTDETAKTKFGDTKFKLITSTGERMNSVVKRNYPSTEETSFLPEHKNGLSNEFRCYASFECKYWQFRTPESK